MLEVQERLDVARDRLVVKVTYFVVDILGLPKAVFVSFIELKRHFDIIIFNNQCVLLCDEI